jgi:hypothetical protein
LIFQNRFSVDLKNFSTFKRLIGRMLDIELAWRPWFGFNGALCNATAAAGARRNQPRVCEILTAHAEQGAAVLQAFADDFSCMTPLQTLMLVSDAQACGRVDRFSRHGSMSRDVALQGWSRVCCRTS